MLASNILCGDLDLYLRCHQWVNGSCLAECVVCSTDVRFTHSIPLFRGYHLHSCLCFGAGIDGGCPPAPSGINDLSQCWLSSLGVWFCCYQRLVWLLNRSTWWMLFQKLIVCIKFDIYFLLFQIIINSACFLTGTLTASVISANQHDIFVGKFGSNVLSFGQEWRGWLVGLWCLTQCSPIYQLYRGCHFYRWSNLKNNPLSQVMDKLLSHNVVSCTQHHEPGLK
jgi:hypothetical protein